MHFNLLDIIFSAIFIASSLLGLYYGFVISLVRIIALITTIILTIILFPFAEEITSEHISNEVASSTASLVISYFLSHYSANFTSKKIQEIYEKTGTNLIDRILGFWLGVIRGVFIILLVNLACCVIFSGNYINSDNYWDLISPKEETYPKWIKNSASYSVLQQGYNNITKKMNGTYIQKLLKNKKLPGKSKKDEIAEQNPNINMDSLEDLQKRISE